jgi:hypothetical protein
MAKTIKAKKVHRIGERLGINDLPRDWHKSLSVGGICQDPHNNTDTMSFADFFANGGEPEELRGRQRSW